MDELFHDEQVVIVNKPSGLLVHRGWGTDRVTAVSCVRNQTGRYVFPAHRLDRGTSGALIFTFEKELAHRMQVAFEQGEVHKNYLALVRGITPESGLIDHAIAKSKEHERRPARTAFRRLGTHERYSLVLVRPYTGRLHQVRRHLKFISHPMIGDTKYGKAEHNRIWQQWGLARLSLHAACIGFTHPGCDKALQVTAPLPEDLKTPLARVGLLEVAVAAIDALPWEPNPAELQTFAD